MADRRTRGRRWLQQLTDADHALLVDIDSGGRTEVDPDRVEDLLASPALFDAIFPADSTRADPTASGGAGPGPGVVALSAVSPMLTFAAMIHRAWRELDPSSVVAEWTGHHERVPVFAGAELQAFLDDGDHRLFLAELLASYARVASGAVNVRHRGVLHHHRFSDLDPAGMARLLDLVSDEARPGLYRRLGDCSLFLTGVFPDHTARRQFAPIQVERLARSLHGANDELAEALALHGAVGLLERLGRQWYLLAVETAPVQARGLADLTSIGTNFSSARRVLNHLTDRWLYPGALAWTPTPS